MKLIALIGEFDPERVPHRTVPLSLDRTIEELGVDVGYEWVSSEEVVNTSLLERFSGIWAMPGSEYVSRDGALRAIRFARETGLPFFGSCRGFQHVLLEYAQNVLGIVDVDHEETSPNGDQLLVSQLSCSLLDETELIQLEEGSLLAKAYGAEQTSAIYHCSYGLNPEYKAKLFSRDLKIAATFENGEVRAVELKGHPFFTGTLFQPSREILNGDLSPIITDFVKAVSES